MYRGISISDPLLAWPGKSREHVYYEMARVGDISPRPRVISLVKYEQLLCMLLSLDRDKRCKEIKWSGKTLTHHVLGQLSCLAASRSTSSYSVECRSLTYYQYPHAPAEYGVLAGVTGITAILLYLRVRSMYVLSQSYCRRETVGTKAHKGGGYALCSRCPRG